MQQNESRLTVYFDDLFWVGVDERRADDELTVCRIVFGAEPKDYEVHAFLLENWGSLKLSAAIKDETRQTGRVNPKRMQRKIQKQMDDVGVGTKAQRAMKLQQVDGKAARKRKSRLQRELESERRFELKQAKRKRKHRGH